MEGGELFTGALPTGTVGLVGDEPPPEGLAVGEAAGPAATTLKESRLPAPFAETFNR